MLLALQDGEAVEVGLQTADEELYSLVMKKKKGRFRLYIRC